MHVLSKYRRRTGPADTYTAVPVDFRAWVGVGRDFLDFAVQAVIRSSPISTLHVHTLSVGSACRVACGKMPISTSWVRNCAAVSVCVA